MKARAQGRRPQQVGSSPRQSRRKQGSRIRRRWSPALSCLQFLCRLIPEGFRNERTGELIEGRVDTIYVAVHNNTRVRSSQTPHLHDRAGVQRRADGACSLDFKKPSAFTERPSTRPGLNDLPLGEHDFGLVRVIGHVVLFKIDTYDLERCGHSPDPADPTVTCRVMTLMIEPHMRLLARLTRSCPYEMLIFAELCSLSGLTVSHIGEVQIVSIYLMV